MSANSIEILYRHPDARVRKLPAKPLETKNAKKETEFFLAKQVPSTLHGPQWVYEIPLDFARRLLANQPDRYFLLQPAQLVLKRKLAGGLSSEFVTVTNKVANEFLTKEDPDAVAAKASAAEKERLEKAAAAKAAADRKAIEEAEEEERRKREAKDEEEQRRKDAEAAERRAAEDAAALLALQSAPLEDAHAPAPPEAF